MNIHTWYSCCNVILIPQAPPVSFSLRFRRVTEKGRQLVAPFLCQTWSNWISTIQRLKSALRLKLEALIAVKDSHFMGDIYSPAAQPKLSTVVFSTICEALHVPCSLCCWTSIKDGVKTWSVLFPDLLQLIWEWNYKRSGNETTCKQKFENCYEIYYDCSLEVVLKAWRWNLEQQKCLMVCLSLLIEEIRKHKGPPVMNEQERCGKVTYQSFCCQKK